MGGGGYPEASFCWGTSVQYIYFSLNFKILTDQTTFQLTGHLFSVRFSPFLYVFVRLCLFLSVSVCFGLFLSVSVRLGIFLVSVLQSAHIERFSVSCMRDFYMLKKILFFFCFSGFFYCFYHLSATNFQTFLYLHLCLNSYV